GVARGRDRQREALEARLAGAHAVGGEHHRLADAQRGVHHLVARHLRRAFAAARGGGLAVVLGGGHPPARAALLEGDGLFATTVEHEVGLDLHGDTPLCTVSTRYHRKWTVSTTPTP